MVNSVKMKKKKGFFQVQNIENDLSSAKTLLRDEDVSFNHN